MNNCTGVYMNELQRVEFDLLQNFVNICNKLDLKYYLVCGSALGAVKYNGFIPWDDDIDVALLRDDYNIFLEKAPEMLPDYIFLQNYKSDLSFPQIYSKLRNSNTAFIEKSAADLPINHGINIDIFPLDGYPETSYAQKLFEVKKRIYGALLLSVYNVPRKGFSRYLNKFFNFIKLKNHIHFVSARFEKFISKYSSDDSLILCNHGNWQGKLDYSPREHFGSGEFFNFEGLEVRIPKEYDKYLSQKYGDYMSELPEEKQKSHHNCIVCDCNNSYKKYR